MVFFRNRISNYLDFEFHILLIRIHSLTESRSHGAYIPYSSVIWRSKSHSSPQFVPMTKCRSLYCADMNFAEGVLGSNHRTGLGEYHRQRAACITIANMSTTQNDIISIRSHDPYLARRRYRNNLATIKLE